MRCSVVLDPDRDTEGHCGCLVLYHSELRRLKWCLVRVRGRVGDLEVGIWIGRMIGIAFGMGRRAAAAAAAQLPVRPPQELAPSIRCWVRSGLIVVASCYLELSSEVSSVFSRHALGVKARL